MSRRRNSRRGYRSVRVKSTNPRLLPVNIRRSRPVDQGVFFSASRSSAQYGTLIRTVLGDTNRSLERRARRVERSSIGRIVPFHAKLTRAMNRARALEPNIIYCLRRKIRKEVLFAKDLTSKGSGGKKHFKPSSAYRCK